MNSIKSINLYLWFSMLTGLFFSASLFAQSSFSRLSQPSDLTYISGSDKRSLEPTESEKDAKTLANSIEFEVYKMTDSGMSRTVYESPAGICHGFQSMHGVSYSNSTHHYIHPDNKREYYGSVSGATLYQNRSSDNVSYVPVYSISDPELSRKIQNRENQHLREKAKNHISEARSILNNVVCF